MLTLNMLEFSDTDEIGVTVAKPTAPRRIIGVAAPDAHHVAPVTQRIIGVAGQVNETRRIEHVLRPDPPAKLIESVPGATPLKPKLIDRLPAPIKNLIHAITSK